MSKQMNKQVIEARILMIRTAINYLKTKSLTDINSIFQASRLELLNAYLDSCDRLLNDLEFIRFQIRYSKKRDAI